MFNYVYYFVSVCETVQGNSGAYQSQKASDSLDLKLQSA